MRCHPGVGRRGVGGHRPRRRGLGTQNTEACRRPRHSPCRKQVSSIHDRPAITTTSQRPNPQCARSENPGFSVLSAPATLPLPPVRFSKFRVARSDPRLSVQLFFQGILNFSTKCRNWITNRSLLLPSDFSIFFSPPFFLHLICRAVR